MAAGYYRYIDVMKDVIILDIQQYRISFSVSAGFFDSISVIS